MLEVDVYNLEGTKTGKLALPKEVFGAKVNSALMAQAVAVFLSNQRKAQAKTKRRGEVERTKAKIYRQKGTGRARHGARSAPIFVGGGKAHGPTGEQNYALKLPTKMRRTSLLSALSTKFSQKKILVVEGLEKLSGKTKEMVSLLTKIASEETKKKKKEKFLLVLPEKGKNILLAARNLPHLSIGLVSQLNSYQILQAGTILLTKEGVKFLKEKYGQS